MKRSRLILVLLFFAFLIRYIGHNWDLGMHLHPDERAIIMFADKIHFFDQLNPHFFAYGSLPIYLLKGITQLSDFLFKTNIATYDGMLTVGRLMSVFMDVGTTAMVYLIARRLFASERIAFLSSFLYSIAFFPIQNAHFYVVDVILNFLLTALIYQLIRFTENPSGKRVLGITVTMAAALATKITPVIFIPYIMVVFTIPRFTDHSWKHRLSRIIRYETLFTLCIPLFYFVFMPYAFLDSFQFIHDMGEQLRMNSDPYTFPFTLQYVGTPIYLYYLKNIILWGLGPFISILGCVGAYLMARQLMRAGGKQHAKLIHVISKYREFFIWVLMYLYYTLVIGRSAVKFMRYMLPVYPFVTILAGYGLYRLIVTIFPKSKKHEIDVHRNRKYLMGAILLPVLIWFASFLSIYSVKHTRIAASEWIHANIPSGSTLATEHWDDGLPVYGAEQYRFQEMTLYEQPDDAAKWDVLTHKLAQSDYLIIASNRLYVPLQRLYDCTKYKQCYPRTRAYYELLLNNRLSGNGYRYQKVAEFSAYPTVPLSKQLFGREIVIHDQGADESFTVYDHPLILIYKNTRK